MNIKCKNCGSYAINPNQHGRDPDKDLDLCDVCYWRKRAEIAQLQINNMYKEQDEKREKELNTVKEQLLYLQVGATKEKESFMDYFTGPKDPITVKGEP